MPGWLEDQIPSFFNANATPGDPMSQKALEARRDLVKAIMSRRSQGYPKNVGEGLTALGEGIGDRMQMNRLAEAEAVRTKGLTASGAAAEKLYNDSQGAVTPGVVRPTPGVRTRADAAPAEDSALAYAPPPYAAETSALLGGPGGAELDPRDLVTAAAMPDEQPGGGRSVPFTTASGEPAAQEPTGEPATPAPSFAGPVPLPPRRPVYDRNRQIAEMNADPTLKPRLLAMAQGENPKNLGVQLASAFNRANARDQSLEQILRDTGTSPRSGYYPPETFTRGQAPESALTDVLRGADVGGPELGFSPTGNASGGVAQRGVTSGRYNVAGRMPGDTETYVQQETPAQLANLERTRVPGAPYAPPDNAQAAITQALNPVRMAQAARTNPPIASPIPAAGATPDATYAPRGIPPTPNLGQVEDQARTPPPQPTPPTRAEMLATIRMMHTDDPDVQRQYAPIVLAEQAKRKFTDDANMKRWESQNANFIANQAAARIAPETSIKIEKGLQEIRDTRTPFDTAGPGLPPGVVDPRLGTDASPQRTGVPNIPRAPTGYGDKEWRDAHTKDIITAQQVARSTTEAVQDTIRVLDQIKSHPGRYWGLGITADQAAKIGDSDAIGFAALVDQAKARAFLAGVSGMKGSGLAPISNAEGEKLAATTARLERKQSPRDFDNSIDDLEIQLRTTLERQQRANNMPVTAWQKTPNDPIAPDKGQPGIRGGKPVIYIGGDPGDNSSYKVAR